MEAIGQLEAVACEFDSIDAELEKLKHEVMTSSPHFPTSLSRHETRITNCEKAISKAISRANREASASATEVLNLGPISKEGERSLDTLVKGHLEHNHCRSVAQLMDSNSDKDESSELADFEVKALNLFDHILNGTLTVGTAAMASINRETYTYLLEVGKNLQFFHALSLGVDKAYSYLLANQKVATKLAGKLVSTSQAEAQHEFETLKTAIFNRLLLYYGAQQTFVATRSNPKSDLEVLYDTSAVAMKKCLKELQMINWGPSGELPYELDVECFHPIFVCPVTQEQSQSSTLVMLKCGHLYSPEASVALTSKSGTYKCPYCPSTGTMSDIRLVELSMN